MTDKDRELKQPTINEIIDFLQKKGEVLHSNRRFSL